MRSSDQKNHDNDAAVGCLDPLGVISGDMDRVAGMFGTHDWDVNSSKPYSEDGVIIHYTCKNCNAEGYSIVTTKDSAASKLIESRLLNPFLENPRI